MYCSACGVKNEPGTLKCFICDKTLAPMAGAGDKVDSRPRRSRPTPQNEPFGSVGDRMLALLADRLLIAALVTIPLAAFADYLNPSSRWLVALVVSAVVIFIFAYHMFFEAAFGATLGKAIFGLRVRGEDGSRNTFQSAAIRNALRLPDGLLLYVPAFFSALFTSRKQRIGDQVAHAVVIEEKIHWAARGGWILLWVITVAGALAFAAYLRPEARFDGLFTSLSGLR